MTEGKDGRPLLEVDVRDRYEGKTTTALRWLAEGKRCKGYPGWTRVLVVTDYRVWEHTTRMARESGMFDTPYLEDRPDSFTRTAPADLARRIYFLKDWQHARGCSSDTEVWLDDTEIHLRNLLQGNGRLARVSLTGRTVTGPR